MSNNDMMVAAFNKACKDFGYNGHIDKLKEGKYVFAKGNLYYAAGDITQMLACMKSYTYEQDNTDFRDAIRHNMGF